MIEIKKVSKRFDKIAAVSDVSLSIEQGQVFGLLGTNGAGKSTLLRMMAGVLKPEEGEILVDGEAVWDCVEAKQKFFYISDEQYFFPNATPLDMAAFYKTLYPAFNEKRFRKFLVKFTLQKDRKIQTFSKGMKKQLSILFGICSGVEYLFCDETFDGLDPVMRQGIKSILANEIDERKFTPIIASHNLRELEDICDHVGLLHKGGVLLSKDLETMKCNIQKVQCALPGEDDKKLEKMFDILQFNRRGKLGQHFFTDIPQSIVGCCMGHGRGPCRTHRLYQITAQKKTAPWQALAEISIFQKNAYHRRNTEIRSHGSCHTKYSQNY